jgi:outer membrane protein assembly factor BamB
MRLACLLLYALPLLAADDDWPDFRGPNRDGVARGDVPLEFGGAKNVAWKTRIPGRGHSSPIVWGNRIFLTTAIPTGVAEADEYKPNLKKEHKLLVMCLDRNTGKVLWQHSPKTFTPPDGYQVPYGSYASNIPTTDGKRLYVYSGSRGIFVYDLEGKLAWQKDFPQMRKRLEFGEGTPTVVDGDTLYLKFDHEGGSYMLALDKNTGKELWRTDRTEQSSWSPPLVVTHNGKKQVITTAARVRSQDAATGKLLWESDGLGLNAIPAPVAANGVVYAMTGFRNPNLLAIKLGREGNLTGTDAIVWSNNRGNSYTPSPVLKDDILYFVTDTAMLSAFKASTGTPLYQQQRLGGAYSLKASPVAVNGKLYIATEQGDVVVTKMGEKFEVLATNKVADDIFIATPAVAGNSMYLRGANALYCIRESSPQRGVF